MFPADFEYLAPSSLDEAVTMLAQHGDDAKVLAGGQSLIPLMKLRFAAPSYLIDINRVSGLGVLDERSDGLHIGALVRTTDMERSPALADRYPLFRSAAPLISDPIVRNLGTVVGSLCHADPQGDWASVMLATNAELVARSGAGERMIPATELIDGPFTTTIRPDEIVTEVRVPRPTGTPFGRYLKLERKIGDFATVGVAVHLELEGGRVTNAGIGLTAVGPANIKASEAERALVGKVFEAGVIEEAADLASSSASPVTDIRGSADYKREMVRVFVRRALGAAAAERAA